MSEPAKVAFFLSNPGHHAAMLGPVVSRLVDRNVSCRALSLCGLRGREAPKAAFEATVEMREIGPQRRPATQSAIGRPTSRRRRWLRSLVWHVSLARPLRAAVADGMRLAVVPNDAAYPFDRIVDRLRANRVPVLLVQEGIRFPLPTEAARTYGSRADALAVWGVASADHFRKAGIDEGAIAVTGCPRFDDVLPPAPADSGALALVTNPVDDQGFCSRQAKLDIVARFVAGVPEGRRVILRCHPGERVEDYLEAMPPSARERVEPRSEGDLDDLVAQVDGVVVLASTVGLEALLAGRALGVLPLPDHGYVFDYVASGAAIGFDLDRELAPQIDQLLESTHRAAAVGRYLDRHLAYRGQAAERLASLIIDRWNP